LCNPSHGDSEDRLFEGWELNRALDGLFYLLIQVYYLSPFILHYSRGHQFDSLICHFCNHSYYGLWQYLSLKGPHSKNLLHNLLYGSHRLFISFCFPMYYFFFFFLNCLHFLFSVPFSLIYFLLSSVSF